MDDEMIQPTLAFRSMLMAELPTGLWADVLATLHDLTERTECDIDPRRGHCLQHAWYETDPPCPQARARELLKTVGLEP